MISSAALPHRNLQQVGEQVGVEGRAAGHGMEQGAVVVVERGQLGPDPVDDLDRDLEADRLSGAIRGAGPLRPSRGGRAASERSRGCTSAGQAAGLPVDEVDEGGSARSPSCSSAQRAATATPTCPSTTMCRSLPMSARSSVSAGGRGHGR